MANQAPGILATYFFYAIVLTIPVSIIILLRYRHAVVRGMRAGSSLPWSRMVPRSSCSPFTPAANGNDTRAALEETVVRRRIAVIYSLAGATAAAVLAALMLWSAGPGLSALRGFTVWYVQAWPLVPILAVLLAWPRGRALWAFALYIVAGVLSVLAGSLFHSWCWGAKRQPRSRTRDPSSCCSRWKPGSPTSDSRHRRAQGASVGCQPLVLAALLVFSYSSLVLLNVFVTRWTIRPG